MTPDSRRITWIALGALIVGLLAGAAMRSAAMPGSDAVVRVLEPVGTLWVNAIRMTIVPLVISMLIAAVASSDSLRSMGRLGGAALFYFVATLALTAAIAAILGGLFFEGLRIDPQASASLRESATSNAQQVTATVRGMGGFAQRLVELVPANPFRAAADAAMLPLIVFAMIFGAALSRVAPAQRDVTVSFFRGVSDAMLQVIRWVFLAAPIGVFALAVVVGSRLGYAAVGAVGFYVGVFSLLCVIVIVVLYAIVLVLAPVGVRQFAAAALPAQVIGLGSRSSSAALPAMIDASRNQLQLPAPIVSFVLPAAVAVFRVTVPISFVLGGLFLGKLYGVTLTTPQVLELALISILMSFSVPPVPSGSMFVMAPVLASFGIPIEGIAILIAIDAIPDLFKTVGNVTGHISSAVVVSRVTTPDELRHANGV